MDRECDALRHCEERSDEAIQSEVAANTVAFFLRASRALRHRRSEATPFFERLWLAMTLNAWRRRGRTLRGGYFTLPDSRSTKISTSATAL
jgi:hypothetical protein